jgi:hypothetical protein
MPPVMITHRHHLLRRSEKERHNDCLRKVAEAGETTRFGTLYLIEDGSHMIKAGVAAQHQIDNRHGNLQTGNPHPLRIVTLCFFYSREIASVVESELKRRHKPRRAQGGSEWFDTPREELARDVLSLAHDLALTQMRAAVSATPIRPELASYFYGLLMFDIVDGELRQSWEATPSISELQRVAVDSSSGPSSSWISADDQSNTKRGLWDQIRSLVGI